MNRPVKNGAMLVKLATSQSCFPLQYEDYSISLP